MQSFVDKKTFIIANKRLHKDFLTIYMNFLVETFWINIIYYNYKILKIFNLWLQFYASKFSMALENLIKNMLHETLQHEDTHNKILW
jgi:hypothetical protein